MEPQNKVPTLYDWMGGMSAIEKLRQRFYGHVAHDTILQPVFAQMPDTHPQHVAAFIAEVFGGPKNYSAERGGHRHMISRHLGRHLTQIQRRQWVNLLLQTADECGVPDDPEFRSALMSYLEWSTRIAVINSQDGVPEPDEAPMPRWGWGEVLGPYRPVG